MGDKGRQRETKQNHLSPASEGDKGMQRETKGNKAKSSQPSLQTRHGKTKGGKPWETRRDKERQSKAIPPQHPDTPRETKGGKAKSSQPSVQTRHGRQGETKQSEPTPASRHAMGDKGRRRETNQPSIRASRHTMGDKGKQRETFFSKQTTSPNYLRLYKTLPEVPHGCRNFLLIRRPA